MRKQETKTGFYYIGSGTPQLAKLVSIFKRGYAFPDIRQVIGELTHDEHQLPEVIVCEPCFGLAAITHFAGLLAADPNLSGIPFILDAEGMKATDHQQYLMNQLADDMLFIRDCDEILFGRKVRFLHQCKMRRQELDKIQATAIFPHFPALLNEWLKRCFDFVIALTVLTLLIPVFILIALAIWAESGGPVFYISKRAGRGYRIFNFYKFRTMYRGSDRQLVELSHLNQYRAGQDSRFFKIKNDPRITRIGRFLRNTSLDELPQLINVLTGDMALVGNRPLPLYEAKTLTTDELAKRFLAPAGITGLWQIRNRGMDEMNEADRIGLDINYADRSGFLYDLWIMANTANAMIQKANV